MNNLNSFYQSYFYGTHRYLIISFFSSINLAALVISLLTENENQKYIERRGSGSTSRYKYFKYTQVLYGKKWLPKVYLTGHFHIQDKPKFSKILVRNFQKILYCFSKK